MGVIRVGGIHGVGKTTIIKKALEKNGTSAPIIKGSELMAEFLKISPEQSPFILKCSRDEFKIESKD